MKVNWWKTLGLLAFTLIFAFAGCSGSSGDPDTGDGDAGEGDGDGGGDYTICQEDKDCPTGQKCRGGVCEAVTACDCNYDCGGRSSNLICNRGSHECEPGTAPADQCSDNCDCYANETCSGGQCVPSGGDGVECNQDADCNQAEGEVCKDSVCVPGPCTTREDCEGPICLICQAGTCTEPPAVCQGDDHCCMGFHCNFGVCIEDDTGECLENDDCVDPEKPRCVDKVCMPECMSNLDCSGGMICIDQKCVSPGCTPEQCDLGEWCDPDAANGMGACVPGCDSHDDCPGQLCNYPTHQCIADCCGGCQANEYCDTDSCTCQTKCQTDPECGPGFKCNQQTGECEPEGGGEGTPCTSDADCSAGLLCDMCTVCWPLDKPATNACQFECSMTQPCPRTDLECLFRRLDGQKSMCLPTIP